MIKVEVQGVNVLDVYNQLKAVLNQFKSFVDSDRAMDDKAPGIVDTVVSAVAAPSMDVSNLAPQATIQGVPTTTVAMQPDSVSMATSNTAVQVTPTQVAVTAPAVNVATDTAVNVATDTPVQTAAAPVQTTVTAPVSQEVKKYTLPEIQAALAPLLDAGKAVELQQLMTQFGVQYLGQVPEDRYPELVNAIRGLGARI
jgi:hypothetical protein